MKKILFTVIAIICSLSAWCQYQLIDMGITILRNNQDVNQDVNQAVNQNVRKAIDTFNNGGLNVDQIEYHPKIDCKFYIKAFSLFDKNKKETNLEASYYHDCSRRSVIRYDFSLESSYYNDLNEQLIKNKFILVKDDGNELIYHNEVDIQCNILYPEYGKVTVFVEKKENDGM